MCEENSILEKIALINYVIERFSEFLQNKLKDLSESPTAKLWLQYLEMIDILHSLVKAEGTGNWLLHLRAVLPYSAALGHKFYTKILRLYLQDTYKLEKEHPAVFLAFKNGQHVVRRSERFWAGLSSDRDSYTVAPLRRMLLVTKQA